MHNFTNRSQRFDIHDHIHQIEKNQQAKKSYIEVSKLMEALNMY